MGAFGGSWIAIAVILGIVCLALSTLWLSVEDPMAPIGAPLRPPGWGRGLGSNSFGQDVQSQLAHGAGRALALGSLVAVSATAFAATAGVAAGMTGRGRPFWTTFIDLALALPVLPLLVLVLAVSGVGFWPLVVALSITGWPAFARVVRTQVIGVSRKDYVTAARALGATVPWMLRTCIVPELAPLLWTKLLLTVRWAILMEGSLGVLGLADPGRPSWGLMLHQALTYPFLFLNGSWWWWAAPPALAIAALTTALAVIGRDIDLILNPSVGQKLGTTRETRSPAERQPRTTGWDTVPTGSESILDPMGGLRALP
jgi:ABC-type dipeptide/oligopeptide/nickel transport system permease subunit